MAIINVYPTTHFAKAYKNLPENIRVLTKQKEQFFKVSPFDSKLNTHKLKGRFKGYWAYSIDYHYRIMFKFIDKETVIYYDIGAHDIYK